MGRNETRVDMRLFFAEDEIPLLLARNVRRVLPVEVVTQARNHAIVIQVINQFNFTSIFLFFSQMVSRTHGSLPERGATSLHGPERVLSGEGV